MKLLALLFAFYLLALSCVPCICEDNCANDKTEQSHTNGKQQTDNCSSLCSCSCCQPVVDNLKQALPAKKLPEFSGKINFALNDQYYSSYNCHNIWQPPKFG